MKVIKQLGRSEGWRHGAELVKLDSPLRLSVDGKTRQTSMAVLARGYLYPVNRKEQIIGDVSDIVRVEVTSECDFCQKYGTGACVACGNDGQVKCVNAE